MSSPAAQPALAGPSSNGSRSFVDLPREVQREIVGHCKRDDLVCLALVSRHFRDLAASELYRHFTLVLPDTSSPYVSDEVDPLAIGFNTFVTSDHNYAQYLRSISLDTLYLGDKAELCCRPYLAYQTCGKFLNTLLQLTLRKARCLESFKWNVRIEPSRPVYKELHQLGTLSHLHIRLHAGASQYLTPPPLPYDPSQPPSSPPPIDITPVSTLPPPPSAFGIIPPPPPTQGFYLPVSNPLPTHQAPKIRHRTAKRPPGVKEPPTLSGFKDLKSLAVLDIDDIDAISELQTCVRNSAGTLTELKLSFSERYAKFARKPSNDPEPEDSEDEDDIMPIPVHPHSQVEDMGSVLQAQELRKTQETVLGKIFGVESTASEKLQEVINDSGKKDKNKKSKEKSNQELIDLVKALASKVLEAVDGTKEPTVSQELVDIINTAAQSYVDEAKLRKEQENTKTDDPSASSSSPGTSKTAGDGVVEEPAEPAVPEISLFSDTPTSPKKKDDNRGADPDDIDIEEPEEQLTIDSEEPTAGELQNTDSQLSEAVAEIPVELPAIPNHTLSEARAEYGKVLASLKSRKAEYQALAEELEAFELQATTLSKEIRRWRSNESSSDINNLGGAESQLLSLTRSIRDMQKEISACQIAIDSAETVPPNELESRKEQVRQMRDYVRETRGLALKSLSIYLIPVKASVLSKAVDLRALRHLSLLNVGVQAPVWSLLYKENKEAPLPLRSIFTDNVSTVFLRFVGSLKEVHELFMLERETSAKPESFAPRTQATIDTIRSMVLKKHMGSLRRLMIKNLADKNWDMDQSAILLLCRQGKRLEELACNMSIRALHCFMQHVSGLTALRALHVVRLRNDDTCVWVMRETKRFLVDAVSHYSHLKLRWLSIDEPDSVDKLVWSTRWTDENEQGDTKGNDATGSTSSSTGVGKGKGKSKGSTGTGKSGKKAKGKGKAGGTSDPLDGSGDLDIAAILAAAGLDEGSSKDEDDEFWGQKIEIVDGLRYCEAEGVKIFEKEIVSGRL
ncbi:uncharacterized protein C8A04DRAFT_10286 [Dichotomopilus funicola]|uniref:F-box domain-containing protein n=1 Tax=Dichotomopilus funicola TaxID=1934379 RepID=A0AAN6V6J0_9PEZI|nr:hypothetical protein C8A04DRAFT_10286 [Dichotomopilus funicola]